MESLSLPSLFLLPPEIRDVIYAFILPSGEDIEVYRCYPVSTTYDKRCVWTKDSVRPHKYPHPTREMSNIMQLNSLIRYEAAKTLYGNNVIAFLQEDFFHFLRTEGSDLADSLQRLRLVTELDWEHPTYNEEVHKIRTMRNIRQLTLSDTYFDDFVYESYWSEVEPLVSELLDLLKPFLDVRDKRKAVGDELRPFQLVLG